MKEFLKHYIDTKPGSVLDTSGKIIGTHEGSELYTIGERHGFTITKKTDHDAPLFVVSKNIEQNTIIVSPRVPLGPDASLKSNIGEISLINMHWIAGKEEDLGKTYGVRFRYRQEKVKSTLIKKDDGYIILPTKNQDDVASGQIAVIYDGDVCVGAGVVV